MKPIDDTKCIHLGQVNQNIKPKTPNGCEECLQIGSEWVQMRKIKKYRY